MEDITIKINLQELLSADAGERIKEAYRAFIKARDALYLWETSDDDTRLKMEKIGTVLTFAVIKICTMSEKRVSELSNDDWKAITATVINGAVFTDGREYSIFVFSKYAEYIEWSVSSYGELFSESVCASILSLSEELKEKELQIRNGEISETQYTEACLWISLEAMVKLMSAYIVSPLNNNGKEYADLLLAASQFAFEYARLKMFSEEQALLTEYTNHQYKLDDELEKKYADYISDVQKQADEFESLITRAFSPDLRESLQRSVDIARAVGVKEEEIIHNFDELDDYFLN